MIMAKQLLEKVWMVFFKLIPDPFEYIRVRRSHIVRIDRIEKKSKREIYINGEAIQIGKTYIDTIAEIKI